MEAQFGAREVPLIPAALYGSRSFVVATTGLLYPVFAATGPYKPGVNVARCWCYHSYMSGTTFMTHNDLSSIACTHKAPDIDCTCGFYAYFGNAGNAAHMTTSGQRVVGIVEASGRCVVGDLGFRAEKIKIVALVGNFPRRDEEPAEEEKPTTRSRVARWLGDKAVNLSKSGVAEKITSSRKGIIAWGVLVVGSQGVMAFGTDPMRIVATVLLGLLIAGYVGVTMGSLVGDIVEVRRRIDVTLDDFYAQPDVTTLQRVQDIYPDIKCFKTLEEAYKHFPPTKLSDLPKED